MTLSSLDIGSLPLAERISLAQQLWDSINTNAYAAPLPPGQADEIKRRLAAADAGQYTEIPAETVFARLSQFE